MSAASVTFPSNAARSERVWSKADRIDDMKKRVMEKKRRKKKKLRDETSDDSPPPTPPPSNVANWIAHPGSWRCGGGMCVEPFVGFMTTCWRAKMLKCGVFMFAYSKGARKRIEPA